MLKESEIRPEHLKAKQHELFDQDIAIFLKYKDDFKRAACPACGNTDSFFVFEKYQLAFEKCPECECVFTNPRPSEESLRNYYTTSRNYAFWAQNIFPLTENVRIEKIFKLRLQQLLNTCSPLKSTKHSLSYLEIGPGFGTFASLAKESSFFSKVSVVEPTTSLADEIEKRGLEVYRCFFEEFSTSDKFDVVCAFEVVEHILHPEKFVNTISDILNPGGIVVISCPNAKSLELEILKERSCAVDIEHVNLFTKKSLKYLFNKYGFSLTEFSTPGSMDIDLIKNGLNESDPEYLRMIFNMGEEKLDTLQKLIRESELSSHMYLVFKKL
jgi:2-polyprenyl-6-hydroxyphenyl methylase/3-demethylubiquinone-9 3-methyltransferase